MIFFGGKGIIILAEIKKRVRVQVGMNEGLLDKDEVGVLGVWVVAYPRGSPKVPAGSPRAEQWSGLTVEKVNRGFEKCICSKRGKGGGVDRASLPKTGPALAGARKNV